jgi:hypothetical protein
MREVRRNYSRLRHGRLASTLVTRRRGLRYTPLVEGLRCRRRQFAAPTGSDAPPNERPRRCMRVNRRFGRAVTNSCLKVWATYARPRRRTRGLQRCRQRTSIRGPSRTHTVGQDVIGGPQGCHMSKCSSAATPRRLEGTPTSLRSPSRRESFLLVSTIEVAYTTCPGRDHAA